MADEEQDKNEQQGGDEADGYYGEDEMDGGDLDLSFLDEEDEEKSGDSSN